MLGIFNILLESFFDTSFEERAVTNHLGQLRRPIAVAVTGCFVAFGVGVLTLLHTGGSGETLSTFIVTFLIGSLLSIAYAIIGAIVSKSAAHRIVGTAGILVALAGVGYIVYLVKSAPF